MRIVIVHPRMSLMGGGERVAIHSIREAMREGHEVYLATEEFDVDSFEDFFGVQGLFKNVQLLTYPPFRRIIPRLYSTRDSSITNRGCERLFPREEHSI